ncbi:MAG TPA: hypothetical protein VMB71_02030 [Acetobacteraceae bacterium]|nr:hypothetical protein [Acetobacteraceae bacterium]
MVRNFGNASSALARLPVGMVAAAFAFSLTVPGVASAAPKEIGLASTSQALTYCQSGAMPANDVAYIAGAPGVVQYGPAKNCVQQVGKGKIKKALYTKGKNVKECNLVSAQAAVSFCDSGEMGTWNIDYIKGKIDTTISGPGYGCGVGTSTSSIGTALCK